MSGRPTIFQIWRALRLPGEVGLFNHSPFRESTARTFFILPNGRQFLDMDSGDHGGPVGFMMRALDVSEREAALLLRKLEHDIADGVWDNK